MVNYFGGAPTALQGGQAFAQDRRRQQLEFDAAEQKRALQQNALMALIGEHGPKAGDPNAWGQVEGITQRAQMFPHALGAAERNTAGMQAVGDQFGAVAADPEAAQAQAAAMEQRRSVAQRAVGALRMVRDNGGDLSGSFNQFATIMQRIGMPAEELQQMQQQVLTNPDSLDELYSLLGAQDGSGIRALGAPVPVYDDATGRARLMQYMSDGSTRIIEGVSPAATLQGEVRLEQGNIRLGQGQQALGLRNRALSNDEARMRGFNAPEGFQIWEDQDGVIHAAPVPGSKPEQDYENRLREANTVDATYARGAEVVMRRARTVEENAARALEYFSGAGGGVILQNIRRGAPLVPGTEMYTAWQALEAVRNNIATGELEDMRKSAANGASGFGQLTERELELLKNSRGIITSTTDPRILVETLTKVVGEFRRIQEIVGSDATAASRRMEERSTRFPNLRAPRAPASPPQSTAPAPQSSGTPSVDDLLRLYSPGGRP